MRSLEACNLARSIVVELKVYGLKASRALSGVRSEHVDTMARAAGSRTLSGFPGGRNPRTDGQAREIGSPLTTFAAPDKSWFCSADQQRSGCGANAFSGLQASTKAGQNLPFRFF